MERELSFYTNLAIPKGKEFGFHKDYLKEWFDTLQNVGIKWFACDGMSSDNFKAGEGERFLDYICNECAKRGLKMSSYHFASGTFHEDDEHLLDIHKRYEKHVEFFSQLKPKSFVVHCGWMADYACDFNEKYKEYCSKYGSETVIERVADNMGYLADLLADKGITVAIETMGGINPLGDFDELMWIIGREKRENIGICIDSGHLMVQGEDPARIIRKTGNLLAETHFHDNLGAKLGKDMHLPVGFGATDWISIQHALDDIGFEGPVTFEVKGWLHQGSVEKGLVKAVEWWREMEKTADYVKENMSRFWPQDLSDATKGE